VDHITRDSDLLQITLELHFLEALQLFLQLEEVRPQHLLKALEFLCLWDLRHLLKPLNLRRGEVDELEVLPQLEVFLNGHNHNPQVPQDHLQGHKGRLNKVWVQVFPVVVMDLLEEV